MKIMNKLLASASALAICLSSSLGATKTNDWFAVEFEGADGYTKDAAVAGVGNWTRSGVNDVSTVIDIDDAGPASSYATNYIVKLDTQGDELKWTPTAQTGNRVLLDTAVYLVGSDEEPETSVGTVQTEVYLSTAGTTTNLYAHVGDGTGEASVWKALSGVTITDKSWVHLRIEIDYDATPNAVSFFVNGVKMYNGEDYSWPVMHLGKTETTVNSVSFKGTGYIDNFVGMKVTEQALPAYSSLADAYITGTGATNGTSFNVSSKNVLTATFPALNGTDTLKYVQLTGANDYVRTYRTSTAGVAQFDVSGLAAGTYSVTAYYGDAPTVVPSEYAPAAEASGGKPAAEVVEGNLVVNVNPVSGLYYTLFVGTNGAQPADLSAAAASTLAMPADEDAGTLTLSLPAPTAPNGVNLIKIYASDESYTNGAAAPTP